MMRTLLLLLLPFLLVISSTDMSETNPSLQPPQLSREQIIAIAKRLAEHRWVCKERNLRAPCVTASPYASDFAAGDSITGIAYDWGGMDDPENYDRRLVKGHAAGSHSRHGITDCTAGIDCSGFVSYCWGQKTTHDYSTRNIRDIGGRPKYNWFTEMKPGDAFNKPGDHIVLFAGYRPDGNPIVYEASGSAGRVIRNDRSTWSRYKDYYPLRYNQTAD